jgi:Na+-driven multidrug efflux pump
MIASHKIIFNTGILYAKLLIVMVLGLFSVRIILGALGETDYGIYSLVAGVVGLLGILQGAMTNASMRFMSHSLGSKDEQIILKTFNTTLFLHFIIGIGVVLIIELGGFFMFDYLLNIPADKVFDAKIVFHFMAITTFITIIAVPYDAVINSHENLFFLSFIDIVGAILKFGIAIYLTYSHLNLLILYGFLLMMVQILMRIIKQRYSVKHYKECKINLRKNIDKSLAKTILSFSGWNLFGSIASMSITQVRSILLNMFFGVGLNAANGVAMQVTGQVNAVSSSMTQALNPQLVKSEGGGDRDRMIRLTELATKYSVFLFALFAIPVIIEMPYLFKLWLKEVPEYAVIFSRLILISLLIDKFTFEITSAIRAVGEIRGFQVTETILALFNIPIAYIFLKIGYPPYSIYYISIFVGTFGFLIRFYFAKKVANMNIVGFIRRGILPILLPLLFSTFLTLTLRYFLDESFFRLLAVSIFFATSISILLFFFGIDINEMNKIFSLIKIIKFRK